MSQEIEDKIVNHLVAKYFLIDVFEKSLSNRNCATRINKGTHYALKLFKQDYNKFLNNYDTFYILKLDISKKTKKNFKRKMKKLNNELDNRDIKVTDYLQVRNSYRGHLSYGDCYNLYNDYSISDKELEGF